jgi:2'-5' RNA ligase
MILKFKDLLLENEQHKFCSTQVTIPTNSELGSKIINYHKLININDLDETHGGLEKQPHVTILYGISPMENSNPKPSDTIDGSMTDPNKKIIKTIQNILHNSASHNFISFETINLKLDKVKSFRNNPNFDVLIIKVSSPELVILNDAFKSALPNQNLYDYNPHITLAYLKKGTAAKYTGENDDEGSTEFVGNIFSSNSFEFCDKFRQKTLISLKKKSENNNTVSEQYMQYKNYFCFKKS